MDRPIHIMDKQIGKRRQRGDGAKDQESERKTERDRQE